MKIRQRHGALGKTMIDCENIGRILTWYSWFKGDIIADIFSNYGELKELRLWVSDILAYAAPFKTDESVAHREKRTRKNFQRTVRRAISDAHSYDAHSRVRHMLDRWYFKGHPKIVANRCCKMLTSPKSLVPPRVCAAVLRTLWNGWCIGRRFLKSGRCCFNCDSYRDSDDSIEHYSCCKIVTGFARLRLGMGPWCWSKGQFIVMGLDEATRTDDDPTIGALLFYSVYKAHNLLRYRPLGQHEARFEIFSQFAKEGTFGHSNVFRCLDSVFSRGAAVGTPYVADRHRVLGYGDAYLS